MVVTERTAEHTPGPWTYDQDLRDLNIGGDHVQTCEALKVCANDGDIEICEVFGRESSDAPLAATYQWIYTPEAWANARRIVACVNACEGVPADELESGVVRIMYEALSGLLAAKDADGLTQFVASSRFADAMNEFAKIRGGAS